MPSNPKLVECGLFDILPVNSLVIDEASQIDVFEFMVSLVLALWAISDTLNQHLFYKFSKKLTKVCFFGDPKQRELQIAYLSPFRLILHQSRLMARGRQVLKQFSTSSI
jgi:hypothetical protein